MRRGLGQAEADPGDHQPQHRAAGIAQEHLGARPPRQAHVPQQKARQRAHQHRQPLRQQRIAGVDRRRGQHRQRRQPEQPAQAVGTVDHVHRIDHAQGGEDGERRRQPAQRGRAHPEHRAEVLHPHPAPIDDEQRRRGLAEDPPVPAQVMQVIQHAEHDQQCGSGQERQRRRAERAAPEKQNQDGEEDGDPAGDRGRHGVILAPGRMVQQVQPPRQRLQRPQQAGGEEKRRQHPVRIEPLELREHRSAFPAARPSLIAFSGIVSSVTYFSRACPLPALAYTA